MLIYLDCDTGIDDALALALRLDDVERAHLRDLAAPTRARRAPVQEAPQRPDPGLLRVMTSLDAAPVLLLGHRSEVLAHNALLHAVLGRRLVPGTPFVRYLFGDPLARQRIRNWAEFAPTAMARCAGRPPAVRTTGGLAGLRRTDPDAAGWWDDHAVRDYVSVAKRIDHPTAGPLEFDIEVVTAPHDPDQRLVVDTARPDSPTARLLPLLASWGTDPAEEPVR